MIPDAEQFNISHLLFQIVFGQDSIFKRLFVHPSGPNPMHISLHTFSRHWKEQNCCPFQSILTFKSLSEKAGPVPLVPEHFTKVFFPCFRSSSQFQVPLESKMKILSSLFLPISPISTNNCLETHLHKDLTAHPTSHLEITAICNIILYELTSSSPAI